MPGHHPNANGRKPRCRDPERIELPCGHVAFRYPEMSRTACLACHPELPVSVVEGAGWAVFRGRLRIVDRRRGRG